MLGDKVQLSQCSLHPIQDVEGRALCRPGLCDLPHQAGRKNVMDLALCLWKLSCCQTFYLKVKHKDFSSVGLKSSNQEKQTQTGVSIYFWQQCSLNKLLTCFLTDCLTNCVSWPVRFLFSDHTMFLLLIEMRDKTEKKNQVVIN